MTGPPSAPLVASLRLAPLLGTGLRLFSDCGVLITVRNSSGAAVRRACYLIGYAKRFKVGQELIIAAVAPRVKIHVGKRPIVRVLDTKAAWNLNHLPRRREGTRGTQRLKVICAPLHLSPQFIIDHWCDHVSIAPIGHLHSRFPITRSGRRWLHHDERWAGTPKHEPETLARSGPRRRGGPARGAAKLCADSTVKRFANEHSWGRR